jgi:hypothetical protein
LGLAIFHKKVTIELLEREERERERERERDYRGSIFERVRIRYLTSGEIYAKIYYVILNNIYLRNFEIFHTVILH